MENTTASARDFAIVERAIHFLIENRFEQPELADAARVSGLSEFHFQRLFTRWAGISPKKFLQYLTLEEAKRSLEQSASVLDAAFDAGLSGPGRLHDLFVSLHAVSPGEFKSRGAGMHLRYAFHPTVLGECLTVMSERGLTGLSFVTDGGREDALAEHRLGWEGASWTADATAGRDVIAAVFERSRESGNGAEPLSVLVRGTPYQVRVWEALLRIPPGCVTTYAGLAERMGLGRTSARAIGTACASNRVGLLIPCHRVIRDSGAVTGYRWGADRKRALLAMEAARSAALTAGALELGAAN